MDSTVIGVFEDLVQTEQARSEIMALQIPTIDIEIYDRTGVQLMGGSEASTIDYWEKLYETLVFGPSNQTLDQDDARQGGTVMSVRANDSVMNEITDILHRNGTVNINKHRVIRDS